MQKVWFGQIVEYCWDSIELARGGVWVRHCNAAFM